MDDKVLVSACLLGENCKYSGGNNYSEKVAAFIADKTVIPVCAEVLGGLPVPWDVDELCCRAKKIGLEALHLDLGSGDDGYALTRPENWQAWLERAARHGRPGRGGGLCPLAEILRPVYPRQRRHPSRIGGQMPREGRQ